MTKTTPIEQGAEAPSIDTRRNLLTRAGITATAMAFLTGLGPVGAYLASGGEARGQTATFTDTDVLNFALNLEYLEGNYYSLGAMGTGVPANLTTGTGAQGGVNGGSRVPFANSFFFQVAAKIAVDEADHINFLRTQLGSAAAAQPLIDLAGGFAQAAAASGAAVPGTVFNPFANEINFFLGAFALTEVGVTAYAGAAALLTNPNNIAAAASILATEAYHAGAIRTILLQSSLGASQPNFQNVAADAPAGGLLPFQTQAIANAQSQLSGAITSSGITLPTNQGPKITNTDSNSLNFQRSPQQVINVVYGGPSRNQGNFFPSGLNGNIR